jgi:hypothetical protein
VVLARLLLGRDANDGGKKPERFWPTLVGERPLLHLECEAFSLARKGFGRAKQRLPRQLELQIIWQHIPSDPAAACVSD